MRADASAAPSAFALAGATLLAGDRLELVADGHLGVADGRIVAIGEGTPPAGLGPVVDARGLLLMPGLVNTHTHLGDAVAKELGAGVPAGVNLLWQPDGLRHVKMAEAGREARVDGLRRAVRRALATGTVALADFREGGLDGVHELREASRDLPVRCLAIARLSRFPVHTDDVLDANQAGLSPEQAEEIRAALAVADGFSPLWANDTTDAGLRQISELVRASGGLLATHAGETGDYRAISRARTGSSDVTRIAEHLRPDFVVHMTAAEDAELDLAAAAGLPIVMCPRTQAALGYGLPPFAAARARGIRVGLGTDNAMTSSPDLLAEMEYLSRAARSAAANPTAVLAREVLAAATIDGARILGIDDDLGSLAVGKEATVVAVDLGSDNLVGSVDPIASVVDRATADDVRAVLVRGRVVHGHLADGEVAR
jgi:cytosine/adenosine deaminase-related metal-dependent hydrolase